MKLKKLKANKTNKQKREKEHNPTEHSKPTKKANAPKPNIKPVTMETKEMWTAPQRWNVSQTIKTNLSWAIYRVCKVDLSDFCNPEAGGGGGGGILTSGHWQFAYWYFISYMFKIQNMKG